MKTGGWVCMGRPPQPCLQGVTARTAMSRLPCNILPLNAVRGTDLESRGGVTGPRWPGAPGRERRAQCPRLSELPCQTAVGSPVGWLSKQWSTGLDAAQSLAPSSRFVIMAVAYLSTARIDGMPTMCRSQRGLLGRKTGGCVMVSAQVPRFRPGFAHLPPRLRCSYMISKTLCE